MTTLQVLHGIPPESGSPHRHNHGSQLRLHNLPDQLSSSHFAAKNILARLLGRIRSTDSKYYARYGEWVKAHPKLEDFCFQCVRPQIWIFLQGRWCLDALKAIGGDLKFEGRGIYLNGVLGCDKRVRIYVGQLTCIRQRVAQHLNFRYRRDHPSLHYCAMQQSQYNTMGILASLPPPPGPDSSALPGMDRPDLLLNILEMCMCLLFQSLPPQTCRLWSDGLEQTASVGNDGIGSQMGGLNLSSPLDQGDAGKDWIDLSDFNDPLVRDYISMRSGPDKLKPSKKHFEAAEGTSPQDESTDNMRWVVWGGLAASLVFIWLSSRNGPHLRYKDHIS